MGPRQKNSALVRTVPNLMGHVCACATSKRAYVPCKAKASHPGRAARMYLRWLRGRFRAGGA